MLNWRKFSNLWHHSIPCCAANPQVLFHKWLPDLYTIYEHVSIFQIIQNFTDLAISLVSNSWYLDLLSPHDCAINFPNFAANRYAKSKCYRSLSLYRLFKTAYAANQVTADHCIVWLNFQDAAELNPEIWWINLVTYSCAKLIICRKSL